MMKTLSNYMYENIASLINEGSLSTLQQEVITCIIFDEYFNKGTIKGMKENEIRDYLKENNCFEVAVNNVQGFSNVQPSDLDKKWMTSYYNQIKTFENFIKKHNFQSTNLKFVHHDSAFGIRNGVPSFNEPICKRVELARDMYNSGTKDDLQKADIYVIAGDEVISETPEKNIEQELDFWISNVNNFIGVSLKKLARIGNNHHLYNADESLLSGVVYKPNINFDPFSKSSKKGSDYDLKVSAGIDFFLKWGDSTLCKNINLRSGGLSINLSKHKLSEYYRPPFALELNTTKFSSKKLDSLKHEYDDIDNPTLDAQEGKLKNQFDRILKFSNENNDRVLNVTELEQRIDELYGLAEQFDVTISPRVKPSESISKVLIEVINDPEKNPELTAKLVKWSKIVEKQILYLKTIFTTAMTNNPEDPDQGLKDLLFAMVLSAKGVNNKKSLNNEADFSHLPYLMLA